MRFGAFLLAPQYPGQDHGTVLDGTVAAAVAADEARLGTEVLPRLRAGVAGCWH